MDLTAFLPVLVGVLVAASIAMTLLVQRRIEGTPAARRGYGAALKALCDELGLAYENVPTFFDRASGHIGECDVTFEYDIPDATPVLVVEVSTSSLPDDLVIRRVGARLHRDELVGPRQSTGDAAFDAEVEIAGAPARLLELLRSDDDLRRLVRTVAIDLRAVLVARSMQLTRPAFPTTAGELKALVVPMIELCTWLADPDVDRAKPAIGTKVAARLRALRDLRGEARMERLVEFFDQLGRALGGGRSYPNAGGDEFEWRGKRGGRPLRMEVSWSGTVEMAMKVDNRLGHLAFTYDPDEDGSARPPKWDEDEAGPLFLERSIYVEGFGSSEKNVRERLDRLGAPLARRIPEQMRSDRIRYYRLQGDQITVMFWPDIHEMSDPEGQILRAVDLVAACAAAVEAAVRIPGSSGDFDDDSDEGFDDDDSDDDSDEDAPDDAT